MMEARADEIIKKLNDMAELDGDLSESKLGQLDLFGIRGMRFLDISHEKLLELVEEIGYPRQDLAAELWESNQYEAKILSCMLSDPNEITEKQADDLVNSMSSWMLSEYFCGKILWKLPFALKKAAEWADSNTETVLCTGFNLIASIAYRASETTGGKPGFFDNALFLARKHASDASQLVRKSISSALAMIGKINRNWHEAAVETAEEIAMQPSAEARWVASQALGELRSTRVSNSLFQGE
ncbi:MAG: DNA alkylation repair protein [Synergistaceae bacterium]|jgi:3-methyladenine DNA glycosylase AlkD|nr:DNA alkylation repair protein [Synergistaceae bacterium]